MEPLASRLRPLNLDEYIGQSHLVGKDQPLRKAIEEKHLFSFVLWGPPGVGKTTLARLYAQAVEAQFYELSAVSAGKADVQKILDEPNWGRPKILFLDEIHRFNKAQQDFLLPHVEKGELFLIGATTENPSFEVIPALLSRCRVFTLVSLDESQMELILERTKIPLTPEAKQILISLADGDARQAISTLDYAQRFYGDVNVDTLKQAVQSKHLRYDKKGEEHYNIISAFIKSMRASQPDAALYYLARMIEAGEDPKFIARRMVIFASEDVGLAQPTALVVANEVFRAVEVIGYPECALNLAHGAAYLAQCKKDRSVNDALKAARQDVQQHGNLPVPMVLRNAPTKLMKESGYGKGYELYIKQDLMPEKLQGKKYL
jgi:putative ATPase